MKKLKAALLGAGNRGQIYCDYALTCPDELEIVSVIDINPFKMNEAGDKYGIKSDMRFLSLDEFIKANVECDFVVNATMDEMHYTQNDDGTTTVYSDYYHYGKHLVVRIAKIIVE